MSALELLTLDGLVLNDSTFGLMAVDCPPPRQRQEWIGAADSEWQALARDALHENRKVTATLAVAPQSTMDLAMDKIGQLVDKLQKASKYTDGIALTWAPADGTRTVTFDVLAGEIVSMPIDNENGWVLAKAPTISIEMTCKPYWRGTETLTSTTTSAVPLVTMELVNNSGDVPALGRLIVTDNATQSRRLVEWGIEGPLTYNSSTALLLDSDNLVTSGFAGSQVAAGGYDPNATGSNVIRATLYSQPTAVCGTGDQSHIGTFRVIARFVPSADDIWVRFSWQAGDGPVVSNGWTSHPQWQNWVEQDLGTVLVPPVTSGTQRWTGRVEAYSGTTAGATIEVDFLELVPVTDGYGKARATYSYAAGVIVGSDDFTSTTAGAALNARSAPAGGTWATSGSATDFTFVDTVGGLSQEAASRATTSDASPRFAILGATSYTDTEVSASVRQTSPPTSSSTLDLGVIARWVDSSNYLRATFTKYTSGSLVRQLVLEQVVAGASTTLATVTLSAVTPVASNTWVTVRLLAFATGRVIAMLLDGTGAQVGDSIDVSSSALAAAGALATGKPGIYDRNLSSTAITRYYDSFQVATPAAEPIVIYSGRNMEVRHDNTIRQNSTGTFTGHPQSYRGSRFVVPVGTSRVAVRVRRDDTDAATAGSVTDSTSIQVGITPRGLAVPR